MKEARVELTTYNPTNDPSLALTHIAFARVQILHRVSLAKPGDTDVDARWGVGGVRHVVVDQPKHRTRGEIVQFCWVLQWAKRQKNDWFLYSAPALTHLWRNYFLFTVLSFGSESR